MKRSTITGIVVLGLLGLTAKEIMDFNDQASILEFKVFTDNSDWRRCPSGLYNAAGDSVSTCVVGDDTIVDISYAWLARLPVNSVRINAGPFKRGKRRVYYDTGIYNRLSMTNSYVAADEVNTVFIASDSVVVQSTVNDKQTFGFIGHALSFSTDGSEHMSSIRFGSTRLGVLEVYRSGSITRMRLTL